MPVAPRRARAMRCAERAAVVAAAAQDALWSSCTRRMIRWSSSVRPSARLGPAAVLTRVPADTVPPLPFSTSQLGAQARGARVVRALTRRAVSEAGVPVQLEATVTKGAGHRVRFVHNGKPLPFQAVPSNDAFVITVNTTAPAAGVTDRWRAEVYGPHAPTAITSHIYVVSAPAE